MEISKGIRIVDLCLIWDKTLIIPDVHIGFEEALNKQGILAPRFQFQETMEKIQSIVEQTKPEEVILMGDIKHEFGTISETEWRQTLLLLDYLISKTKKIFLVKGNHDTILGPIANKRELKIVDYVIKEATFFCHGDQIPKNEDFKKAKRIIIGHEHAAICLKKGERAERYKCFIKGEYNGKELIVMPSFNLVTTGTDVSRESLLSPFLKKSDIQDFEVFVVDKKPLYFGTVKDCLEMN